MKPIVIVEEFPESPDQNVIYVKLSTREILFYTPLGFSNFKASLPASQDLFIDTSVTVVGSSGSDGDGSGDGSDDGSEDGSGDESDDGNSSNEVSAAELSDNSRLYNGDGYFLDSDVGRQIVGIGTGGGQTSRGLVDGQNYIIDSVFSPISGTPYYEKARFANPSDVDGSGVGNGILLWKHRLNNGGQIFWEFVYPDE